MMKEWIEHTWYNPHPVRWLLYPFSLIYQCISLIRKSFLIHFKQKVVDVPIIVVGNLTVGGSGKTPVVIAVAQELTKKGIAVGIVSRGYKASVSEYPYLVKPDSNANEVGDEPLLISEKTKCPVVISPKRMDAVEYLIKHYGCQVIISDDGLQHYAMGRAIEIAVIDGSRGLGNGLILPAGPLREKASRLRSVDFMICNEGEWPNAYKMKLVPGPFKAVATGKIIDQESMEKPIAAMAGIGNPGRFFETLSRLNIEYNPYSLPDHHSYQAHEMNYSEKTWLMTEKDAVKCRVFARKGMYFLPVDASIDSSFWQALWTHKSIKDLY